MERIDCGTARLREGNSRFSQATVQGEYFNHQGIRGKPSRPKGQQSKDMLGDTATQGIQSSSYCAPSPVVVELEARDVSLKNLDATQKLK